MLPSCVELYTFRCYSCGLPHVNAQSDQRLPNFGSFVSLQTKKTSKNLSKAPVLACHSCYPWQHLRQMNRRVQSWSDWMWLGWPELGLHFLPSLLRPCSLLWALLSKTICLHSFRCLTTLCKSFFPVICKSSSNSDHLISTVGFLFSVFPPFWQPLFVGTRISPGVFCFPSNLARPWSPPSLSQRSRRWKGRKFKLTDFRFVRRWNLRDFRLPPRSPWDLPSSGMLHSVDW